MKSRTPRQKKMKRQARLQSAQHWIKTYTGKSLIKGYRKHFSVDIVCAIKELQILGVKFDNAYVTQLLTNHEQTVTAKQKLKVNQELEYSGDSDGRFYYIAGHTGGVFPYGITWEEAEALE